eukprot:CAMPEP_0174838324 /NCGR_PEP_ID=MMETSP1114-20130205/7322_1 /TAXON_ID=312471 /ORGANISM="Neobodo designis, Strain CCAP 1951/1" /LENGTH=81 /DNA_ID=CAMNT_0016072421 /DNA_START=39 /DNA_END=280 /DNA_ORIENTATION=+
MSAEAALLAVVDACDRVERCFGPDSTASEEERAAAWAAHLRALEAVRAGAAAAEAEGTNDEEVPADVLASIAAGDVSAALG